MLETRVFSVSAVSAVFRKPRADDELTLIIFRQLFGNQRRASSTLFIKSCLKNYQSSSQATSTSSSASLLAKSFATFIIISFFFFEPRFRAFNCSLYPVIQLSNSTVEIPRASFVCHCAVPLYFRFQISIICLT